MITAPMANILFAIDQFFIVLLCFVFSLVFGVWCLVFSLVFGVWCLVFGGSDLAIRAEQGGSIY